MILHVLCRFMGIAEQMGRALQRTSISVNIKERLDFSCAMFGPDGSLVANAPHLPVHLGAMSEAVRFQVTCPPLPPGAGMFPHLTNLRRALRIILCADSLHSLDLQNAPSPFQILPHIVKLGQSDADGMHTLLKFFAGAKCWTKQRRSHRQEC